jgi:hypothetical protein
VATAATYRIGPSDFFTPGDLEADAQTLDGQVDQLDGQVEGSDVAPPDFLDQWTSWHTDWKTFLGSHFGGYLSSLFASLNNGNRDDLVRYENQFAAFAARASTFGAAVIAPVAPSTGTKDTLGDQLKAQTSGLGLPSLPSFESIAVVAVAIIVLVVVWKWKAA